MNPDVAACAGEPCRQCQEATKEMVAEAVVRYMCQGVKASKAPVVLSRICIIERCQGVHKLFMCWVPFRTFDTLQCGYVLGCRTSVLFTGFRVSEQDILLRTPEIMMAECCNALPAAAMSYLFCSLPLCHSCKD